MSLFYSTFLLQLLIFFSGKTVQIVAFIGIISSKFNAHPCLVVVPNSTIPNWVREFERWAPQLRVVPYYGEAKSREIIRKYELSHNTSDKTTTGAKYHVLITTYETLTNPKEFGMVFNSTPRWETLVVDEGQRRKLYSWSKDSTDLALFQSRATTV